jgi:hypothetical protein
MNGIALGWGRPAWLDLGAAAGVIVAVALALAPAVAPWMAVTDMRLALPTATRPAGVPAPSPPGDPAAVLAMLSQDPVVRASGAIYQAAMLRPSRSGAAALASPFDDDPHARIQRAARVVDALLAAPRTAAVSEGASLDLEPAITQAASMAGVDAGFLRRTAVRESGLNPFAVAGASSARGLFQFVDQTWLTSVAKWGRRHGLAREATAVRFSPSGRAYVADPGVGRAILMLRYQPTYSARLAAELTAENAAVLSEGLGRPAGARELYAAHLLGPTGALRLIQAAEARPSTPAATLFPGAARRNPGLFYRAGAPRSVSELLLSLS